MKRIFAFLVFCLAGLSLQAQDRFSYSVEVVAGVGIGRGPLAALAPQFVAEYHIGSGFSIGAGAGTRIAKPCLQYITQNGTQKRSFCQELDIPVFLRIGYGINKFYVNVDAGYAIGALSIYDAGWVPGGKKEPCYNGLFVDPHIGLKLGRHSALAVGVLLQRSTVYDHVTTESGDMNSGSYTITTQVTERQLLTPAITLRYGFVF